MSEESHKYMLSKMEWILVYIALAHTVYIATEIYQMKIMAGNWEKAYDKIRQQLWAKDKQLRELAEKFPIAEAETTPSNG